MAVPEGAGSRRSIGTYSVLAGLTPLIPAPFLDDIVRSYFRRRLVRVLAAARGAALADTDVHVLADQPAQGCLSGCLLAPLLYLLKRLFRKIFFFLEWKRAIDTASETYHFGALVDHALDRRWLAPPGRHSAAALRAAIDGVLARRGTSPIDKAVRETFQRSKGMVIAAARSLGGALRGLTRRTRREQVEGAVESVTRSEAPQVEGVAEALDQAVARAAPGYLEELCALVADELQEGHE